MIRNTEALGGWTAERLARLLEMAHRKISLARDTHSCPIF